MSNDSKVFTVRVWVNTYDWSVQIQSFYCLKSSLFSFKYDIGVEELMMHIDLLLCVLVVDLGLGWRYHLDCHD